MPVRPGTQGCPEFLHAQALTRRELLRVGGLGTLGLSLPALLAAEASAADYGGERPRARAKSCILLFLSGGPSQYETFDPKPDAPSENRSIFGTTATNVPGTHLCELLPDLAPLANRFALIRSAWHKYGGHFGGHRYALTGYAAPGNADQASRPDDKPGIIGLAAKYLPPRGSFPLAVMLPWSATDQGNGASGGMGGGTLGKQYNPLLVEADPATLEKPGQKGKETPKPPGPNHGPRFRVPELALQAGVSPERFGNRRELLEQIETQRRTLLTNADTGEMDRLYQKAYDLLLSPAIRDAFDLEKETDKLRDHYGRNAFGQSCLMARRLVEQGARFVQVNFSRFVTQPGYGWDTHGKGRETLQDHLLPKLNAGLASLLTDLHERGLLRDTLVVAMGEFGRTPKVKADGGRDHWAKCYSLLLAGGGVHGGLVYGKSDKTGANPAADPVEARDLLVTLLTLLGMPTMAPDVQGRVAPLFPDAQPIDRLYA